MGTSLNAISIQSHTPPTPNQSPIYLLSSGLLQNKIANMKVIIKENFQRKFSNLNKLQYSLGS